MIIYQEKFTRKPATTSCKSADNTGIKHAFRSVCVHLISKLSSSHIRTETELAQARYFDEYILIHEVNSLYFDMIFFWL